MIRIIAHWSSVFVFATPWAAALIFSDAWININTTIIGANAIQIKPNNFLILFIIILLIVYVFVNFIVNVNGSYYKWNRSHANRIP